MSRRRLALFAVAAVLVLLFGGRWVALRYTEHVWFAELGQGARFRALFLRSVLWQAALFLAALAWYAAHTLAVYRSIGSVHLPRRLGGLEIDEAVPGRVLRGIALGVAGLLALATTYTFNDLGDYVALARHAAPFRLSEPVLQQDAAFYLATLPLLELLQLLAMISVLLATAISVGLYALTGSFTVTRRRLRITPHARTHVVVLLGALALVLAWGFHLDAYETVAGGGHHEGALTGVDRVVRIPASSALSLIALVVAAGSVLSLRWIRPALLLSLWATFGVAAVLGRLVIPVLADAWGAAANPTLQQTIAQYTDGFSRAGFGLLDLPVHNVGAGELRAESTAALEEAVQGVYAWSGEREIPARLLEEAGGDTSHTRVWTVSPVAVQAGGHERPAALAVSQTDPGAMARLVPRPRWTPLHRGAFAWAGEPVLIEAGLRTGALQYLASPGAADPAPTDTPVRRVQGRVRFLPRIAELGVVGPDESTFEEQGPGVMLGTFPRRLLLAWALQSPPLLDDHTSNADRILYWRDLPTRLARLYPFAAFDPARAVLAGGRLIWVADGYLMSGRFPLAEHVRWHGDDVNYLAAPYVVSVDAVNGLTRFFLRPGASAFAVSVAEAALAAPLAPDSMAPALRQELRYPTGLLGAQAAMIARRGIDGPGGAPWSLAWADSSAAGRDAALVQPTLAFIALEPPRVQAWQIVPLTDAAGTRLAGLLAASATAAGVPQLRVLRTDGPAAITPLAAISRIAATPLVQAAVAAAGSEAGSHRGRLFVVPAGGGLVYGQALYAPARTNEPFRMTTLVLLSGARLGLGADARTAVRSLMRGEGEGMSALITGEEMAQAQAAFLALDSARGAGDWERFGRAWSALRRALHLEAARAGARP